jgi:hypothetical protein
MKLRVAALAVVLGSGLLSTNPVRGQASANFKLYEHTLNAAGNPAGGTVLASSNFRITLDALGQGIMGPGLASTSWRMDAGFVSGYPPPGEVTGVRFGADHITLTWNPEMSVGTYDLYRGVARVFLPDFGSCDQYGLTSETAADSDVPSVGSGFFYLVTARNRLREEGTKGLYASGTERPNPIPCP